MESTESKFITPEELSEKCRLNFEKGDEAWKIEPLIQDLI
jgi:hypothetical protein